MAEKKPQTYANHARLVPMYHVVLFLILTVNLIWSGWLLFQNFAFSTVMNLLMAAAFIILFFYARLFALAAQDRLIRLEERLRLREILPEDLVPRIGELTEDQLIGLRFASDGEVADLVRQVLDGRLVRRKEIKQAIKTWRPDTYRV